MRITAVALSVGLLFGMAPVVGDQAAQPSLAPAAVGAAATAAPDATVAPAASTTFYYSRADVEEMWRAMNNINNVCSVLPLPYLVSLACRPPAALADAIASAHYQKKRIKAVYSYCGATYCNSYKYTVVS